MELFDKEGKLLPGIHSMTGDDFIEIFCEKGNRTEYKQAIINIFFAIVIVFVFYQL